MATDTDIVSFVGLHHTAIVGPDHWHRNRAQPIQLTLQLHLAPSYLNKSGQSDDVADSLHYSQLVDAAAHRIGAQTQGYTSTRMLVEDVTDAAFRFATSAMCDQQSDAPAAAQHTTSDPTTLVHAVRVVLALPKQILLAPVFEVELTTRASEYWGSESGSSSGPGSAPESATAEVEAGLGLSGAGAIVRVGGLVLPVLIGVNPPERLAKQRVVTHLTFFEAPRTRTEGAAGIAEIDYPALVQQITTDIERTAYLTLEKLVYEIVRLAFDVADAHASTNAHAARIDAITVRCQKPSAISSADASSVEITRTRATL